MNEEMIRQMVRKALLEKSESQTSFKVPVEASGRHVHLSQDDVEKLFGKGHKLTKVKDISQKGQFLCEERVNIVGPKNQYTNVAVLGPARSKTQVEISLTDAKFLGVKAPVALSGDLSKAVDMIITAEDKYLIAEKSTIIAKNHIHMDLMDAKKYSIKDGDLVDVVMETERPLCFKDVVVRVDDSFTLAMHIDYDEANACLYRKGDAGIIKGNSELKQSDCVKEADKNTCEKENCALIKEKLLTEDMVLALWKKGTEKIIVSKKTIVSPLAKDCIRQKRIRVEVE